MQLKTICYCAFATIAAGSLLIVTAAKRPGVRPPAAKVTQGSLVRLDAKGNIQDFCPLKQTNVRADISGFLARVTVTQQFVNPSKEKIEAVYTFPLPQNSAVDDMTMLVGGRKVKGVIKRREEARAMYDAARNSGHVAALLDQERPNIFTQSVANIMPGEAVNITISYVEKLEYEAGSYQFVFPMVVAPRYMAASVTDAGNIAPPVMTEGTRAGHDITMEVNLDAGVPVTNLQSPTHGVVVSQSGDRKAIVHLKDQTTIPNKDFILKYDVAGKGIEDALLAYNPGKGGYFTLILQPPQRVTPQEATPKEIVFVLDTSGSMMGFPIETAKRTMKLVLDQMNPKDTFNMITFSGDEHILFPKPVPATRENIRIAQEFLATRAGRGGTEMMKAIRASLDPSDQQDHVRVACFITDGEVGNDMEIIAEVQKHPMARVFSMGIGSSINRFLLENMARYGRGEVDYIGLEDDGEAAAQRFHERVRNPLLTDISIDWGGLAVSDVYPSRIPDLFGSKPVVVTGRYTGAGSGVIRLRGKMAGRPFEREIRVSLPASEPKHDVIATLWARSRVEDLMSQDWLGAQRGMQRPDLRESITQVGLDYKLMTQYTSFVAVEETTITDGGKARRIDVPVEMPQGMSFDGVFGQPQESHSPGAPKQFAQSRPTASIYPSSIGGYRGAAPPPPQPIGRRVADAEAYREVRKTPVSKIDPTLLGRPAGTKIDVQIWLTDVSPQMLEKLKQMGVEILGQPKGARVVIARVSAEKLQAISALHEVAFISPLKK